jgi:hypothetical protein
MVSRIQKVHDMDKTPKWIPLLFGGVMVLMGAVILGALIGIVPTNEGGHFVAPPPIIASLGIVLAAGGVLLWMPCQSPPSLRTLLFLMALAMVAIVCNWAAFAPDVVYESSTSIGPIGIIGNTDTGARIACGIVALVVNATFISTLIASVRVALRGSSEHT